MDELGIEVKVLSCIVHQREAQDLLLARKTGLKLIYFLYPHTRKLAETIFSHIKRYDQLPHSKTELLNGLDWSTNGELNELDRASIAKIADRVYADTNPGTFGLYRDQLKMNWMRHVAMNKLDQGVGLLEAGRVDEFSDLLRNIPATISAETQDHMVRVDPLRDNVAEILEDLEYRRTHPELNQAIPTGIAWLDEHMGGWRKGENYLLFAYTGRGKSWAGTQFCYHAAWLGFKVVKFTLEMKALKDVDRFYTRMTGIPYAAIRDPWKMTDRQVDLLRARITEWQERGCVYHVRSSNRRITVGEIESELTALPFNPDLLVVDQMTDIASSLEWKDMALVARDLQYLAKGWNQQDGLAVVTFGQAKTPTQWAPYLTVEDFAFGRAPCDWSTAVLYLAQTQEDQDNEIIRAGICKDRDNQFVRAQGILYPNREIGRIHDPEREERERRAEEEDAFPSL